MKDWVCKNKKKLMVAALAALVAMGAMSDAARKTAMDLMDKVMPAEEVAPVTSDDAPAAAEEPAAEAPADEAPKAE